MYWSLGIYEFSVGVPLRFGSWDQLSSAGCKIFDQGGAGVVAAEGEN